MEKIEFKDLPDTTTPLSASNLNTMQDNIEEAIDLTNTYSSDEVLIGKWINNKPIYRKTFNFGTLPDTTEKSISTNLNANDVHIVKIYGIAYRSSDDTYYTLPYASPTDENNISCLVVKTNNILNIKLISGYDRTNVQECYITLEYTKTID